MGILSQAAQIVILAEDVRHRKIINRYLRSKGYSPHQIRILLPDVLHRQTAGLTFIRTEYAIQIKALREVLTKRSTYLIVVADADDGTFEDRITDLDARLTAFSQPNRSEAEPILLIVPRRNVETWMYFIAGNSVDEETDYNPQCRSFDDGQWAANFVKFARNPLPQSCPDSLRRACQTELPRIP